MFRVAKKRVDPKKVLVVLEEFKTVRCSLWGIKPANNPVHRQGLTPDTDAANSSTLKKVTESKGFAGTANRVWTRQYSADWVSDLEVCPQLADEKIDWE